MSESRSAAEPTLCDLCGSRETTVALAGRYPLLRCSICGLLYVFPRPSAAELRDSYENGTAASVDVVGQLKETPKKTMVARMDLRRIHSYVAGGDLLEVGCGAGYFLNRAARRGYRVTGTEINRTLVVAATSNPELRILEGDLLEMPLNPESFDVVYVRNVLSHLDRPRQTIERIVDLLRPRGILALETGNFAELDDRALAYLDRSGLLGVPDHLFFFGPSQIKRLVSAVGLDMSESVRHSLALNDRVMSLAGGWSGHHRPQPNPHKLRSFSPKDFLAGAASFVLAYPLGRVLPKENRPCTDRYIFVKPARSPD